MMTERRETTVNVERPPPTTQPVYKEPVRESSSTGVLVGIILAILVIGVIAFMLWPASAPDGTDTDVTIETPASPPAPAPEPATPPAATAPEPAPPPADTAPELPAPAPEPAPEPAPAPAQ
jgi:hypothetical protein